MLAKKVLYTGIHFFSEEIGNILRNAGYCEDIAGEVKPEAHVTLSFKPSVAEKEAFAAFVGKEVSCHISAIGELWKEGTLCNVGLLVDAIDANIESKNDVVHITCWINGEAIGADGKKLAKAVETAKCSFDKALDLELRGVFTVFNGKNEWSSSIEL